jgi:hypothetical protein
MVTRAAQRGVATHVPWKTVRVPSWNAQSTPPFRVGAAAMSCSVRLLVVVNPGIAEGVVAWGSRRTPSNILSAENFGRSL